MEELSRSISHRKYFRYVTNLIGATHGDGAKQDDFPLLMAEEAAGDWQRQSINTYILTTSIKNIKGYWKGNRIAEIIELINDSKITVTKIGKGNKEKRKISDTYPKWELMASNVCRRSFCINLY